MCNRYKYIFKYRLRKDTKKCRSMNEIFRRKSNLHNDHVFQVLAQWNWFVSLFPVVASFINELLFCPENRPQSVWSTIKCCSNGLNYKWTIQYAEQILLNDYRHFICLAIWQTLMMMSAFQRYTKNRSRSIIHRNQNMMQLKIAQQDYYM